MSLWKSGIRGRAEPIGFKKYAESQIQLLYEKDADAILTTIGSTDLQTAITNLQSGQILEVQTNATYDPITIVGDKAISIRVAIGYNPKLTGDRCIRLNNGARDVIISGLSIENATNGGGNNNYTGTAITFGEHQTIVENIIFHNITIKNTTVGSSVLLSYHWSVGGDLYYNPAQLNELSNKVAFLNCNIYEGCLDGNEGACILLRGIKNSVITNCYIDNNNDVGRGIMLQGFLNCVLENNWIYNIGGTNAEGIKVDEIGTSPFIQKCWIINNFIDTAIEGIDVDDNVSAYVIGNVCTNCSNEGISLDDSSQGVFVDNTVFNNLDGIRFEVGSLGELSNNNSFNNTNNNFRMDNGYTPDASNISDANRYNNKPVIQGRNI